MVLALNACAKHAHRGLCLMLWIIYDKELKSYVLTIMTEW
jgi:hypothetical protein